MAPAATAGHSRGNEAATITVPSLPGSGVASGTRVGLHQPCTPLAGRSRSAYDSPPRRSGSGSISPGGSRETVSGSPLSGTQIETSSATAVSLRSWFIESTEMRFWSLTRRTSQTIRCERIVWVPIASMVLSSRTLAARSASASPVPSTTTW